MFFDDYPLFYESSQTASSAGRLDARHEAMIVANHDILQGARVLDLASHDGRWSFAALKAGASHVTGVEARQELVDNAEKTFAEYGVDSDSYRFVCGDMFAVLEEQQFEVDVVLCLGFIYHTLRYPALFSGIRALNPKHLVIDTKVIVSDAPIVELTVNRTGVQSNAAEDRYTHRRKVVAGWPSVPALDLMLDVYDFDVEDRYDWHALIERRTDIAPGALRDYGTDNRVTMRCRTRRRRRPQPEQASPQDASPQAAD